MKLDLSHPSPVAGKRILVTGGSSGYGRALVLDLQSRGARVATCARSEGPLATLADQGVLCQRADVGSTADVTALIATVRRAWGGLDGVVNNAAVLPRASLRSLSPTHWRGVMDANLTGVWLVTRQALEIMDSGTIVNVTSGLAWFPMEPYNAYCVAKAGVNMLTRAFAQELGSRFRVNAVDPGVARTRMNPSAELPPEAAVPILRYLVAVGHHGPTGHCFKKSGVSVPWESEPVLA